MIRVFWDKVDLGDNSYCNRLNGEGCRMFHTGNGKFDFTGIAYQQLDWIQQHQ